MRSELILAVALLAACQTSDAPPADQSTAAPADTASGRTAAPEAPSAPAESAAVAPMDTATYLTANGWGPLRTGMTRAEVVAALGEDANPNAVGGPDPEQCDQFRPTRAPPGMIVMIVQGRLARITLVDGSAVKTTEGFGVGADGAAILAAYGDRAVTAPHEYLDTPAQYITVWARGSTGPDARGVRYVTGMDGRVTDVHAGGPAIEYVEGCL